MVDQLSAGLRRTSGMVGARWVGTHSQFGVNSVRELAYAVRVDFECEFRWPIDGSTLALLVGDWLLGVRA